MKEVIGTVKLEVDIVVLLDSTVSFCFSLISGSVIYKSSNSGFFRPLKLKKVDPQVIVVSKQITDV